MLNKIDKIEKVKRDDELIRWTRMSVVTTCVLIVLLNPRKIINRMFELSKKIMIKLRILLIKIKGVFES